MTVLRKYISLFLNAILLVPSISIASNNNLEDNTNRISNENLPSNTLNYLKNDLYIIGEGDKLNLTIFDSPELSGPLSVLSDGNIQVPIVGNIFIKGMTLDQATNEIKNKLGEHLLNPAIFLKIIQTRPIKISVIGEINNPGIYSLSSSAENQEFKNKTFNISGIPTVVDAIQRAGGITNNADLRNVNLERKLPGLNNKYKSTNLNLISLISDGNQIYNPFLFDGDRIILKKALNNSKESFKIAEANLSPEFINLNIIGEVKNPGIIKVKANTSLNQSILLAGGPTNWRANKGKVTLVRVNRNGTIYHKSFRLNLSDPPSEIRNPILKDGDSVYVPTSKFASFSDSVTAISRPASGIVTVWSLFKIIGD